MDAWGLELIPNLHCWQHEIPYKNATSMLQSTTLLECSKQEFYLFFFVFVFSRIGKPRFGQVTNWCLGLRETVLEPQTGKHLEDLFITAHEPIIKKSKDLIAIRGGGSQGDQERPRTEL